MICIHTAAFDFSLPLSPAISDFMFLVRIQNIQHMFQGPRGLLCGTRHSQDQLSNKEGRKYSCSWNKSVSQAHGLQPIKGQQATGMSSCEWSFWLHGAGRSQAIEHLRILISNQAPGGRWRLCKWWAGWCPSDVSHLDSSGWIPPLSPTPCELFRPSDRLVLWLGGGPQLLNLHEWEELDLCMNQGTSREGGGWCREAVMF